MRNMVFQLCILGLACTAWAENNQTLWASLAALQPGQRIQIAGMNSNKHSGTFVNVSDTALSYRDNAGEQTIQKQGVHSVRLMENKHRLRNALIVGGVGAGVGAGIGAATFHSCTGQPFCIQPAGRGSITGIGAAVGFLGGAVVGVLLPSNKMIYRAPAQ